MTFSKASVALLLRRLSVYHSSYFHSSIPIVGVGIWAVFSLFALIFQCDLPDPWRVTSPQCHARVGLISAVVISNVVTDFILAVYIIPGVWKLSMKQNVRLTVVSLFATRLVVCILGCIQVLRFLQYSKSPDQTCKNTYTPILRRLLLTLNSKGDNLRPAIMAKYFTPSSSTLTIKSLTKRAALLSIFPSFQQPSPESMAFSQLSKQDAPPLVSSSQGIAITWLDVSGLTWTRPALILHSHARQKTAIPQPEVTGTSYDWFPSITFS
jgi:hypothetical protein